MGADFSKDEYARCDRETVITTNTIESYLSVFKRDMKGTYEHCAKKYLHRYLVEFDFRYNNRIALGVMIPTARRS
jgi:transposase-like protein